MLQPRTSHDAKAESFENGWRLEIAEGNPGTYRLAQVDDYASLARRRFLWQEHTTLSLSCRISQPALPGTWGFGLWNDPFTVSFGLQGTARRLPALPNACWFFHASAENHLSFASNQPASGFLAQCFSSPRIPSALLAPGVFASPFLLIRSLSRWLREYITAKLIREDAHSLSLDVTKWHDYRLRWSPHRVEFVIDNATAFETATSSKGPLGLVIWIDNQFAAWKPDGSLRMGTLANPPAWMEIRDLTVESKT